MNRNEKSSLYNTVSEAITEWRKLRDEFYKTNPEEINFPMVVLPENYKWMKSIRHNDYRWMEPPYTTVDNQD